jgi:hypothetical protein
MGRGRGGDLTSKPQQANKPCSIESIYEMKIALIMSQPNQLVIIYRQSGKPYMPVYLFRVFTKNLSRKTSLLLMAGL